MNRDWPATTPAGRSPAPPLPRGAGITLLSGSVLGTIPSGIAPPAPRQTRFRLSGSVLAFVSALLCAGALAAPAGAAPIKDVDLSAYPTVRVTTVSPRGGARPPVLRENGRPVRTLAENLGRSKSVVLAIDRSRSMEGPALSAAIRAARAFVAGKAPGDRIGLVDFGSRSSGAPRFSTATIDADIALRVLNVDAQQGTALYDAVVDASRSLAGEALPGRVIVVLTDGSDTSSSATLREAIAAAREAGASVHSIGLESGQFSRAPLRALASQTGGAYHPSGSAAGLLASYSAVAGELERTWRLEYLTAARPGERLRLETLTRGDGSARASVTIPAEAGRSGSTSGSGGLGPSALYDSAAGTALVAIGVGLIVLLATIFGTTAVRGARLRRRLAPHLATTSSTTRKAAGEQQRLPFLAGLFKATEHALAHLKPWQVVARMLERADLPLRAVELFYTVLAAGLLVASVGTIVGLPSFFIFLGLLAGGSLPLLVVWFKGKRRTAAFENQLPDLLITLAASLKAGHSFKTGLQTLVDEGRPPASKELNRVLAEARLGRPIEDSLFEMATRIGSKDFDFVITAVTIQTQVGGSLAGLVDMVADTVRQRQQFARKIRGLTAMGRAGAYVLVALPFLLAIVLTLINGEYMAPLYNTSTGHTIIFIGLAMMGVGCVLLRRIVSFKG